jgi:hypothetical protein
MVYALVCHGRRLRHADLHLVVLLLLGGKGDVVCQQLLSKVLVYGAGPPV